MGKGKRTKVTAKGRLDQYYTLAKSQGYRARSAFKLIQLNRKYGFLEKSRCTIDLCAAPGGWLQVAAKTMPQNSIIVGVDLVPIQPIPKVTTFACDITTDKCRSLIRNELKDWKADVVLHDGAPNVGTAWVQDAFSQAELVLMSLKLAVVFLNQGGTFVTKIFRSADYNSLLYVFNELFGQVEATKPPASRAVSAEIFVVCRNYKAPAKIDPKFLDPHHVFKEFAVDKTSSLDNELVPAGSTATNIWHPEKHKRNRTGYAEGDLTLYHPVHANDFVMSVEPVSVLSVASAIIFVSEKERDYLKLPITTSEVVENCKDLKILGRKEFRSLIKWRLAIRDFLNLPSKPKPEATTEEVTIEPMDEDEAIEAELEDRNEKDRAERKRERRRLNERKQKLIQRMQLNMIAPTDIGMEQLEIDGADMDEFDDLEAMRMADLAYQSGRDLEEDGFKSSGYLPIEEDLEAQLDQEYESFKQKRASKDAKHRAAQLRGEQKPWQGLSDDEAKSSEDDKLIDEDEDEDDGSDASSLMDEYKASAKGVQADSEGSSLTRSTTGPTGSSKKALDWFNQPLFRQFNLTGVTQKTERSTVDRVVHDETKPKAAVEKRIRPRQIEDGAGIEIAPAEPELDEPGLTTAEAITIATAYANGQLTKTDIINETFSKSGFIDQAGLPSWFTDDEKRSNFRQKPITKEAVEMLRAKQRALDARPIKKVAEARARRRMKAAREVEKAAQKAQGISENSILSEREKSDSIAKVMQRGSKEAVRAAMRKNSRQKVTLVPSRRGGGGAGGIKGKYKPVDRRLKKDAKSMKRADKKSKARKGKR